MKESTRVLVALGAALALGIAIALSGNATLLSAADAISVVGTIWVNAIRMTVVPLVVSLLVTGIASASDIKSVGRLGGTTLLVFGLLLAAGAAVAVVLAPAVFSLLPDRGASALPLPPGAAQAAAQVAGDQGQTFAAWLTSLVPTNPIAAAANGAMLPLVLFTLLFALAIAHSGSPARATLLAFFQAVSDAMLTLVRWIVLLAPIGVFALLLPLAARTGAGIAGAIGFYVLAYSVLCIAMSLFLYPVVALFGGVPMRRFARAALPAQVIAFGTSSSMASLPALVESAEQGLGLSKRISGFVLPLAVSTFKFAAPVSWTVGALFVGWFYGIPLHARELATIAFAAVFLGPTGPGVPRGAFIMLTPVLLAINLPAEGVGILIALDAIPDTFATVLNTTGNLAAAALVAKSEPPESAAPAPSKVA
jgi:Na+/H+-dicarboxylate symporter